MVDDVSVVIEMVAGTVKDKLVICKGDAPNVKHVIANTESEKLDEGKFYEGIDICKITKIRSTWVHISDHNGVVIISHERFLLAAVENSSYVSRYPPCKEAIGVVFNGSAKKGPKRAVVCFDTVAACPVPFREVKLDFLVDVKKAEANHP